MALFINGVGQDTFNMNGVSIDNLYVDGVLVWSSYVNTKPVISIIGDNPMYLVLNGSAYVEQGATATDTEDGDISSDIVIGGDTPDVSVEGYYYVTYNVSDSEGLAADEQVRTVSVYVVTVPKYELTEALINDGTFDYVPDSNNPDSSFQGKLTESDGTTPYLPTELQYPRNGLLELANGRILDTQLTVDPETDGYGIYGIYDADGSTEYKIWAVRMLSSTLYNLYEGDQDTPITYVSGYEFDPIVGTWKITDGRPSWMPPLVSLRRPAYISFYGATGSVAPPAGVTINDVENSDTAVKALLDIDGNASEFTSQIKTANWTNAFGSTTTIACISEHESEENMRHTYASTSQNIDLYLPEGTYEIQVGSITNPTTDEYWTDITIQGVTKDISARPDTGNHCDVWTVVSIGEIIPVETVRNTGGAYALLNSIRITEVTA